MANKAIISSIGAARLLTSRFYVCSLHVHSPGSHDYGRASDPGESPNVLLENETQLSPPEWISEVEKSGIPLCQHD